MTREEAMDIFEHNWTRLVNPDYTEEELNKAFGIALEALEQEPKTGHWILADIQSEEDIDNDNYRYICSECQHSDIHAKDIEVPYCWNCGAKMEGEEKE